MKDYYLILDVSPFATQDEIKTAFKKMSLKYHPDTNKEDKYFEERFKDIYEAYSILSDLKKRKEYDYNRFEKSRNQEQNKAKNKQREKWEDDLQNKEKSLKKLEDEIAIKESKLTQTKPQKTRRLFLFLFLIALLVAISVMIIMFQKENYYSQLISGSTEKIGALEKENIEYKNNIQSLRDSLNQILAAKNLAELELNEYKKKQKNEIKLSKLSGFELNNNRKKAGKYITLKNVDEVELIDFDWAEYNDETYVKSFSVYNKTDMLLNKVEITWVKLNRDNIPVSYGNFSLGYLENDMIKIGSEFHRVTNGELKISPRLSKKYEVFHIDGLKIDDLLVSKNKQERIELTIKSVYYRGNAKHY